MTQNFNERISYNVFDLNMLGKYAYNYLMVIIDDRIFVSKREQSICANVDIFHIIYFNYNDLCKKAVNRESRCSVSKLVVSKHACELHGSNTEH
jgi:hypothetical protein